MDFGGIKISRGAQCYRLIESEGFVVKDAENDSSQQAGGGFKNHDTPAWFQDSGQLIQGSSRIF